MPVPQEVTRYLDDVTARVGDIFGNRVVGVYTTGSLALGDYRPGRSDIDLMAVVGNSCVSLIIGCCTARPQARSLSCTR